MEKPKLTKTVLLVVTSDNYNEKLRDPLWELVSLIQEIADIHHETGDTVNLQAFDGEAPAANFLVLAEQQKLPKEP